MLSSTERFLERSIPDVLVRSALQIARSGLNLSSSECLLNDHRVGSLAQPQRQIRDHHCGCWTVWDEHDDSNLPEIARSYDKNDSSFWTAIDCRAICSQDVISRKQACDASSRGRRRVKIEVTVRRSSSWIDRRQPRDGSVSGTVITHGRNLDWASCVALEFNCRTEFSVLGCVATTDLRNLPHTEVESRAF